MDETYPDIGHNALVILERRYLLRNAQGKEIEAPKLMFERVSITFVSANDLDKDGRDSETEAKEFFEM
jgi:ribonucleoside-diphosphate reductase alpha chain